MRANSAPVIVLLNGAFGIGKTSVARELVTRLPGAVLYDPEIIGIILQRIARVFGRDVPDFQDLRSWRRLTVIALRVTRLFRKTVIVPMAFSDTHPLQEIRAGIDRFEPHQVHFCLIAPVEIVQQRLRTRRSAGAWEFRRAAECCAVHREAIFATHVDAGDRTVREVADEIVRLLGAPR